MRKPRIYLPASLLVNATYTLSEQASQHVNKVLRLRTGDELILFDGQGNQIDARIVDISGKQLQVTTVTNPIMTVKPVINIHLGLAISKGDRMDYAIQKSVEVGVSEITPLETERTVVRLDKKREISRRKHWETIILNACEQCNQNYLPNLHKVKTLHEWVQQKTDSLDLVFDTNADTTLHQLKSQPFIRILIGPEGGLAVDELLYLQQSGFIQTRMGPRILRTETAAVSACVAIQTLWGDYTT